VAWVQAGARARPVKVLPVVAGQTLVAAVEEALALSVQPINQAFLPTAAMV
jgi:hypothetical protein